MRKLIGRVRFSCSNIKNNSNSRNLTEYLPWTSSVGCLTATKKYLLWRRRSPYPNRSNSISASRPQPPMRRGLMRLQLAMPTQSSHQRVWAHSPNRPCAMVLQKMEITIASCSTSLRASRRMSSTKTTSSAASIVHKNQGTLAWKRAKTWMIKHSKCCRTIRLTTW